MVNNNLIPERNLIMEMFPLNNDQLWLTCLRFLWLQPRILSSEYCPRSTGHVYELFSHCEETMVIDWSRVGRGGRRGTEKEICME